MIHHGDCVEVMRGMAENSVDSIVTDPPYELGFMGKKWDGTGIANDPKMWTEALRVLKPGGYLLSFGGTRTYHRMTCAIEDAGFEIRDSLAWMYGSGFPKSLDVSKAMDRAAGAEREAIGRSRNGAGKLMEERPWNVAPDYDRTFPITAPATDLAKQWQGWGTALKPAHEPIVLARKPLIGTVAKNVEQYGTGALNIDASRIGTEAITAHGGGNNQAGRKYGGGNGIPAITAGANPHFGRWPANLLFDEESAAMLDEQSGERKSGKMMPTHTTAGVDGRNAYGADRVGGFTTMETYGDTGGASRFFYTAKASRKDRGEGNHHPTVKPTALMRYLVKLITPPGGIVLDPFGGSGTTGVAAQAEGFPFILIEREAEYIDIINSRLAS